MSQRLNIFTRKLLYHWQAASRNYWTPRPLSCSPVQERQISRNIGIFLRDRAGPAGLTLLLPLLHEINHRSRQRLAQADEELSAAHVVIRPIAGDLPTTSTSQTMWLRVECYNNSGDKVDVKCIVNDGATPTEQNWADATVYFRQTNFTNIAGGRVGFAIGSVYIDDLTIKSDADGDGEFTNDSTTEAVEDFTETSGDGSDKLVHDAAGNLTYDGKYEYAYDAWNRMVTATRAWQGGGAGKTGSAVATIAYDGANRRVSKTIDNSGDWNHTYHFYHDGQAPAGQAKMIETRNGSGEVIKQHVWGTQYVDESIQIGINTDPGEDDDGGEAGTQDNCDTFYWTAQDANYNVIGLFESDGDLVERYEYTPYGQRTVFRSPGSNDVQAMAPTLESRRVVVNDIAQPYGICDIGHQGLMHDKEFGLIYNRRRYLQPVLGIYTGPDPKRYVDGMNYFEDRRSNPVIGRDWQGMGFWAEVWWNMNNRPSSSVGAPPPSAEQWKEYHDKSRERKAESDQAELYRKQFEHFGSARLVFKDEPVQGASALSLAYIKYWGPSRNPDSYEYEVGLRKGRSDILTTRGTYVPNQDVKLWGVGRRHAKAWKNKWLKFAQQYPRKAGIPRMHVWIEGRSGTEVPGHQGICFGTIFSWGNGGKAKHIQCFKYGLKDVLGVGFGYLKTGLAPYCDLAEVEVEDEGSSGYIDPAMSISIPTDVGREILRKLNSMVGKKKYKGPYFLFSTGLTGKSFTKARGLDDRRSKGTSNMYTCREWAADRFKEVKEWVLQKKGIVVQFSRP